MQKKQNIYQPDRLFPSLPTYGYDNCEEAECDYDYLKFLYPSSSKKVQIMVEDECDKLEYMGSFMFDEYPDRLQLCFLANKIYSKLEQNHSLPDLTATHRHQEQRPCCRQDDWFRNMIEIMLVNEMAARRRRYRGRNRWY